MKNLSIALAVVTSTAAFANQDYLIKSGDALAMDTALNLAQTHIQADERISQDRNGHYLLAGINPYTQGECQILMKKGKAHGERGLSYALGVRDTDPETQRKNNPHIEALDVKRFQAWASHSDDIVRNDAYSTKIRTSYVTPFWLGSRSTSKLEVNGDDISVTSAFTQSPVNFKSRHFDRVESAEDLREITFYNYNELRPSDQIHCEFSF